jgi:hypothetical protein
VSDGGFFTDTEGDYILHVDDRRNLFDHPDERRLTGCCGPDGTSGPNQVCPCGAEVATLRADCWIPHCVIFSNGAVELVDADKLDEPIRRLYWHPRSLTNPWRALVVALALGLLVASAMTFHDWRLNPGGLFHGAEGTAWGVVWETWSSWFGPVFFGVLGMLVVPVVFWRLHSDRKTMR